MKQKLFMSVFILLSINFFAKESFPNKNQFAVKCEDGTVFELDTDIKNVYEKLGEPLRKENLWAIYPEASCAFYRIDYEGISFCYYDLDNKIVRIGIFGDNYKILDNEITVGSSYNEIIESYGTPHKEQEFFSNERNEYVNQISYTTQHTELSYVKQTVVYCYGAAFNFDLRKEKCNQILLNFFAIY